MNKKTLMEKGLSEEQADIVLDIWKESMKSLVPRKRLNEVSSRLKEAKQTIYNLQRDISRYKECLRKSKSYKGKSNNQGGGAKWQVWVAVN